MGNTASCNLCLEKCHHTKKCPLYERLDYIYVVRRGQCLAGESYFSLQICNGALTGVRQHCRHKSDSHNIRMVFTDGSLRCGQAGCGVWWGLNNPNNVSFRMATQPDNNRAELVAALRAIEQSKKLYPGEKLLIVTDSQFVIDMATKGMRPRNFEVDCVNLGFALQGIEIVWRKCLSHGFAKWYWNDFITVGNHQADFLAWFGGQKSLPANPYV